MEKHKEQSLNERLVKRFAFDTSLKPPFPVKNMMVELKRGCNHKCIFCACEKTTTISTEISPKLLFRIMNEAYELGTRELGFYSVSEPFLCKSLEDYVHEAKQIGFEYVYVTTNGALATEERLKEIIDNGIDSLKFSINAGTRETYNFIHGADDFDKVIDRLKFCYEYRKTSINQFKLYISYIVTRFNAHEVESFKDTYSEYCDYIAFCPLYDLGGLLPEVNTRMRPLSPPQYMLDYGISSKRTCNNLFDSIGVTSEGYLTACGCADFQRYLIVGDLNTTSLYDAWYGEKFTELRKKYIEDSLEGLQCYNCVYGKSEYFEPLNPEYATLINMNDVFTERHLEARLDRFPEFRKFEGVSS